MVNMHRKLEGLKTPIYLRAICLHFKGYTAGDLAFSLQRIPKLKMSLYSPSSFLSISVSLPPPREEEQILPPVSSVSPTRVISSVVSTLTAHTASIKPSVCCPVGNGSLGSYG